MGFIQAKIVITYGSLVGADVDVGFGCRDVGRGPSSQSAVVSQWEASSTASSVVVGLAKMNKTKYLELEVAIGKE